MGQKGYLEWDRKGTLCGTERDVTLSGYLEWDRKGTLSGTEGYLPGVGQKGYLEWDRKGP